MYFHALSSPWGTQFLAGDACFYSRQRAPRTNSIRDVHGARTDGRPAARSAQSQCAVPPLRFARPAAVGYRCARRLARVGRVGSPIGSFRPPDARSHGASTAVFCLILTERGVPAVGAPIHSSVRPASHPAPLSGHPRGPARDLACPEARRLRQPSQASVPHVNEALL